MQLVYAQEPFPNKVFKSIFLAGPTPRSRDVASWRPEALKTLKEQEFDGVVFIPEPRDGSFGGKYDYQGQLNWETEGLNRSDCILFWIPRDLDTLPGFTTNIEWGKWADSGKCVLGAPPNAEKMDYIFDNAQKHQVPYFSSLGFTIDGALQFIGEGAWREGGECFIPLYIWRTPQFQSWYAPFKSSRTCLLNAEIKFVSKNSKNEIYCIILEADMIADEVTKRSDFIIISPDAISSSMRSPNKIFFKITKNSWPSW